MLTGIFFRCGSIANLSAKAFSINLTLQIATSLENRDYGRRVPPRWARDIPFVRKKLALISPTSGSRSVGIVRSQTKATELSYYRQQR
jgi:hypothetical protein